MKIRLTHILVSLFIPLLIGCVKDDLSDCPPESNVTLMFRYLDKDGIDCFKDKHESVIIAVFDETNKYVHSRVISKNSLERFQGDTFYLPAGRYRVVCWGNVFERSQLSPFDKDSKFEQSVLTLETEIPKQSSDPVMYAPRPSSFTKALEEGDAFYLTVPDKGEVRDTIDFVSAHTEFKVIVRGLTDMNRETNVAPDIEIAGLPVRYNFEMGVQDGTEAYKKTSGYTTTSKGPEARAHFYSGNFTEQDPITVKLFSGVDGRLLKEAYLPEYLAANQIDFSTMLERSISIVIEFIEGNEVKITVSVSPWGSSGVSPIW